MVRLRVLLLPLSILVLCSALSPSSKRRRPGTYVRMESSSKRTPTGMEKSVIMEAEENKGVKTDNVTMTSSSKMSFSEHSSYSNCSCECSDEDSMLSSNGTKPIKLRKGVNSTELKKNKKRCCCCQPCCGCCRPCCCCCRPCCGCCGGGCCNNCCNNCCNRCCNNQCCGQQQCCYIKKIILVKKVCCCKKCCCCNNNRCCNNCCNNCNRCCCCRPCCCCCKPCCGCCGGGGCCGCCQPCCGCCGQKKRRKKECTAEDLTECKSCQDDNTSVPVNPFTNSTVPITNEVCPETNEGSCECEEDTSTTTVDPSTSAVVPNRSINSTTTLSSRIRRRHLRRNLTKL